MRWAIRGHPGQHRLAFLVVSLYTWRAHVHKQSFQGCGVSADRRTTVATTFAAALTCAVSAGMIDSAVAQTTTETNVARGQYLAEAGDCTSCHTVSAAQPFAGGL